MTRSLFLVAVLLAGFVLAETIEPVRSDYDKPNYDVSKIAPYSLEDPLVFQDGRKLKDASEWPERRREILDIFAHEMFGVEPPKPEAFVVEKFDEGVTLAGFGIRRQYRMWFKADKTGPAIDWLVLLPRHEKKPVAPIIFLNYGGNHELIRDPEVVVTRAWMPFREGCHAEPQSRGKYENMNNAEFVFPAHAILARGYALVSACYADVSPDTDPGKSRPPEDAFKEGVFTLWPPRDESRDDNTTAIGAWAWALSRGLDLAERIPEIDAKKSIATGYSRLGKTALLAAARDERFAVCVPNQTGGGGCPLAKRDFGENIATAMRMFPHWYCRAYGKYAKNPAKLLTFDQHLLLASIAPRALMVQGFDNPWFDTEGEYLACRAASPVWTFLGRLGLPDRPFPPDYDTSCVGLWLGYVRRTEGHGHSAHDWMWLLDFADHALAATPSAESPLAWPDVTQTMKPWAINWWLGGAADEAGLENQCAEMERAHFGGFNVVHAYASFYNSTHREESPHPLCIPKEECRDFMSEDWLAVWNSAVRIARSHGLGVDLSMCSGWCFGGPWITKEDACSSLLPVHVSGPGGEGYHIDPYSPTAMSHHIARFEAAFGKNGTAERPRAFYHDSFEYYDARPKHGEDADEALLATFGFWTEWCRKNGYETRYQAHGSPGNWLDLYALGSIPETEMFGRKDKDRDILLSKFASSAAHVTGKRLVSAEACTWVDEHFRERPEDVKLMLDQLFLAGVNHVFYHGYSYSPVDAEWPGRSFFASLQMNPRNPLWREVTTLNDYVIRCQSIFQTWQPDNDLLVRWEPDEFRAADPGNVGYLMTIHNGERWFHPTSYGKRARELWANGYQFDFVSDRQLRANPALRARLDVAKAMPSPFSPKANGLMSTRWRKGGRVLHFVVNTQDEPRVLTGRFTVMDPMTGRIADCSRYVLHPLSSVFVEAEEVAVAGLEPKTPDHPLSGLSWRVSPVVGGPVLPPATNLTALTSWTTWDEAFSGTMRYETTFDLPTECAASASLDLDLGEVREAAHVWLNGMDLGCVLICPYRFRLPSSLLKEKGNFLRIEVSSLGANRLRWVCRTNRPWKRFAEENLCNYDYKPFDADKWDVVPCGLLGPVALRDRE